MSMDKNPVSRQQWDHETGSESEEPFAVAPKDCEIPTTHKVGDEIILEEK